MKSNIYWELRRRHFKNLVKKYSWVALLGIICYSLYTLQMIMALGDLQVRPLIILN